MTKQTVNVGNNANDGSGDAARTAFTKLNQNDSELYNQLGADGSGNLPSALPVTKGGTGAMDAGSARNNIGAVATDLGWGTPSPGIEINSANSNAEAFGAISKKTQTIRANAIGSGSAIGDWAVGFNVTTKDLFMGLWANLNDTNIKFVKGSVASPQWAATGVFRTTLNTTTDGNGYLKPSSPVVRLYADKIEAINEAVDKGITFEKLGVGDYLVKNTTGLRTDGWYIETPKDANGNILVFVEFTQLENKDISVKTYKKKFDIDTASIIADHAKPMDIPTDRWIDLRFNDYPIAEQPTPEATS